MPFAAASVPGLLCVVVANYFVVFVVDAALMTLHAVVVAAGIAADFVDRAAGVAAVVAAFVVVLKHLYLGYFVADVHYQFLQQHCRHPFFLVHLKLENPLRPY